MNATDRLIRKLSDFSIGLRNGDVPEESKLRELESALAHVLSEIAERTGDAYEALAADGYLCAYPDCSEVRETHRIGDPGCDYRIVRG